jgi:polyether ionophore transport system permease protein
MTAAVAAIRTAPRAGRGDPRWVIAGHVARNALRGALIWGVVFGIFVIATVKAFVTAYPTVAERLKIASSLQSFAILLGPPRHAETVAGFTEWRVLVVIAVIGAIWGLMTSTGTLRGNEDVGRWELLLSGQTTKRRAAAQALVGLGGALCAMFAVTLVLTLAAGALPGAHFSIGGSFLFAFAMVSGAAMFLAVGAVTSQLSATRGQAAMIAAAVLGASFLVRMIADSRSDLGWLRWASPIGWIEELHPLRDAQPLALVPIVAIVAIGAVLTPALAAKRDLGASVFRERESRGTGRWLAGPITLAVRLVRPAALGWLAGFATIAIVQGFVARSAATIFQSSPAFAAALGKLGVRKASEGYFGVSFLFVAVVIAVMVATQVASIRDEEATGRLDNLLVRPVRRASWLAGRVGVSLALVVLAGFTAGLFTWIGAASQHTGVALWTLVEAGLNTITPGIFVLGAGVLVLGLRPRLSATACYAIVAWSFLVNLLGSLIKGNDWLRDSSLFSHMALAPAAKPDWGTAAIIIAIALAAALAGAIAFDHRDIEYA